MADKESTLAIVIRTVDQATSGLRSINNHIKSLGVLAAPVQLIGERLGALGKEAGLPQLAAGISGVGGAVKDLLGKLLLIGGAVAGGAVAAVGALKSIVDEFATMGHVAKRAGVEVDFLAELRYAAQKTGVPVEALDEGLITFTQNLGLASAGTGRMTAFLQKASPALLAQLKAAHGTADGLGILFDATAKLHDPMKRLALIQKTLGDSALAPLAAMGSKKIMELMAAHAKLVGSQEAAVKSSLEVEEALVDLHATTDGMKAAIITGLGPALKGLVEQLTAWFAGHREDVARWANEIGAKLPGAVDAVVAAVKGAIKFVTSFVDGIGGLKVVAIAVAAVMAGPLLSAIATLGVALLSTPFGWVVISIAAISAAVISLVSEIDKLNKALDTSHEKQLQDLATMSPAEYHAKYKGQKGPNGESIDDDLNASFMDQMHATAAAAPPIADFRSLGNLAPPLDLGSFARNASRPAPAAPPPQDARIKIDFANAPRGTRVTADPSNTADVDLSVGYQMGGF